MLLFLVYFVIYFVYMLAFDGEIKLLKRHSEHFLYSKKSSHGVCIVLNVKTIFDNVLTAKLP